VPPTPGDGGVILSDRVGRLPERQAGRRRNPFQAPVREVTVRIETGKVLRILSNDLKATAQDIADLYKRRWAIEIVFTQMTKARPLAVRTERDDIADFDLTVGDQDTVDQQLHELTPLGEVRAFSDQVGLPA